MTVALHGLRRDPDENDERLSDESGTPTRAATPARAHGHVSAHGAPENPARPAKPPAPRRVSLSPLGHPERSRVPSVTARELQAAVEAELAALPEASRLALPLAVVAARRLALVAAGGAPATTVAALRQLRVELDRLASYAARGRTE